VRVTRGQSTSVTQVNGLANSTRNMVQRQSSSLRNGGRVIGAGMTAGAMVP
jgi:hypothetical protein